MSARHDEVLGEIRKEYDDVITALSAQATKQKNARKQSPGNLTYEPLRAEAAKATAGDAYALLLIATGERFLRQYLFNITVPIAEDAGLQNLIEKVYKEFNLRHPIKLRPDEKLLMEELRKQRNT